MMKRIINLIPKFIKTWFTNLLYNDLASKGINGDTRIAYLTKEQQAFLKSIGGAGTLNPNTGLKQYFGPLAIGLAVGAAGFGIAKLAGASTRTALLAGVLSGLGAGGIKALMTAPTSTGVSAAKGALGAQAAGGSTAAAQQALALEKATTGVASNFGVGSQLTGAFPSAASISAGAPAIPAAAASGIPSTISSAFPTGAEALKLGVAGQTSNVGANLARIPGAISTFVDENPGAVIGGAATLGSLALSNQTPVGTISPSSPEFAGMTGELYQRERERFDPTSERAEYVMAPGALTPANVYERQEEMFAARQGGLATLKLKEGGVNYLPSKSDHDEKDANNYIRAMGYVEDGSGNGDKDEDTMLAQLADGEFVSRADAILGAGIMTGANPDDFKDMRRKGAQFFYKQQDSFKRVYDLVNDRNKAS